MAQLPGGSFNAEEVKPNAAFDPIPAGEYLVMITDSSMEKTKAGDGEYLKLTFKVLQDGEYKGRLIWSNLNLVNKNEKAVEIAQRELSSICHAVGVLTPETSEELHGIPFRGKVRVVPPSGGYPANNSISFFKPADDVEDSPWD